MNEEWKRVRPHAHRLTGFDPLFEQAVAAIVAESADAGSPLGGAQADSEVLRRRLEPFRAEFRALASQVLCSHLGAEGTLDLIDAMSTDAMCRYRRATLQANPALARGLEGLRWRMGETAI